MKFGPEVTTFHRLHCNSRIHNDNVHVHAYNVINVTLLSPYVGLCYNIDDAHRRAKMCSASDESSCQHQCGRISKGKEVTGL